jgi:hypothetical protein
MVKQLGPQHSQLVPKGDWASDLALGTASHNSSLVSLGLIQYRFMQPQQARHQQSQSVSYLQCESRIKNVLGGWSKVEQFAHIGSRLSEGPHQ